MTFLKQGNSIQISLKHHLKVYIFAAMNIFVLVIIQPPKIINYKIIYSNFSDSKY